MKRKNIDLLDKGVESALKTKKGNVDVSTEAFLKAVADGDDVLVRDILNINPKNRAGYFSSKNDKGDNVLLIAVESGHLDVVEVLCDALKGATGFDINAGYGDNKASLLHIAAFAGNKFVVDYLIKQPGINLSLLSAVGLPPIYCAAARGYPEVVEVLYEALKGSAGFDICLLYTSPSPRDRG